MDIVISTKRSAWRDLSTTLEMTLGALEEKENQSIAHNFMLTFYNFYPCVGTQWLFVKKIGQNVC